MYYITTHKHASKKDQAILFWGSDHCGYYYNVCDAGIYSKDDAADIVQNHRDCVMVGLSVAIPLMVDVIFDNSKVVKIIPNTPRCRTVVGIDYKMLLNGETSWGKGTFLTPKQFMIKNNDIIKIALQIMTYSHTTKKDR